MDKHIYQDIQSAVLALKPNEEKFKETYAEVAKDVEYFLFYTKEVTAEEFALFLAGVHLGRLSCQSK